MTVLNQTYQNVNLYVRWCAVLQAWDAIKHMNFAAVRKEKIFYDCLT